MRIRFHPKFPPLRRQAVNAARAAGRVAAAVVRGDDLAVPPEELARRESLCAACDQLRDGRCLLCGCRMNWKRRLLVWHCPSSPPKW